MDMKTESEIVIDIAREFMELIPELAPTWSKAYFRFSMDVSGHGSNASYASGSSVVIIDPFKNATFFAKANAKGVELLNKLQKKRGVVLVQIDSNFNYEVKFEFDDLERWRISKLNGGTGIPQGL